MLKFRISLLIIGLFLLMGCAMNQGIDTVVIEQSPEIEQQATAIDATAVETRGLPITKEVTVQKYKTMTILKKDITATFNGITNGSLSTYYNDGTYKGTIKSISFRVVAKPTDNGDTMTFPMQITYQGTVKRDVEPQSKVVTVQKYKTMTILKKDITATFNGIANGSLSTYYNDGTYKGTIKSISFRVVAKPTDNGSTMTFPMQITYKGTVWTD